MRIKLTIAAGSLVAAAIGGMVLTGTTAQAATAHLASSQGTREQCQAAANQGLTDLHNFGLPLPDPSASMRTIANYLIFDANASPPGAMKNALAADAYNVVYYCLS